MPERNQERRQSGGNLARKKKWPSWWKWELELSSHLLKRMTDRQFTEVDLRRMLEHARGHRVDIEEGRWVIDARHKRAAWEIIVEPDTKTQLLVVVTAYPVEETTVMKQPYLEVTFRHGRPLAAYYYLPRKPGDKSVSTRRVEPGLVIDFAKGGRPIGIEITTPTKFSLGALNRVLRELGFTAATRGELAPVIAA